MCKRITPIIIIILLASVAALPIEVSQSGNQGIPNDWHVVEDGIFTFYIPDAMKRTPLLGLYSGHASAFGGKHISYLVFDYGGASCDRTTSKSVQNGESVFEVSALKGNVVVRQSAISRHITARICFPNVHGKNLSFFAICEDREGVRLAKQIAGTITVRN